VTDQLSSDLASLKIHRDAPPAPSSARRWVWTLVVLGALAAGGYAAYGALAPRVFKEQVAITEVAMISPVQASVVVTSTGYVVPQSWSKIGAKIPGRIAQVNVKEGDQVKAGDVIATLDDADQKSLIAAAASRVAVARARGETARANLAEVKVQTERTRSLVQSGAIGRAQLEDLEAREKALAEAVKAADAEAAAAQAEVDSLRVGLKDRIVTSPIDGTVIAKPAAVGETVGPQLTGVANIAEIADFKSIVVETDVPEGRLDSIKVGGPAEIVLDAYPTRRYRGVVVDLGKRINRAKATVIVKVKFKDTLEGVLPDMSARVSFLREEIKEENLKEKPKKVVSADAVADRGGKKVVFLVEEGKLRPVAVSVGATVGSSVELLEGPPAGARVVAKPTPELYEGQRIKEAEK
jgi:RND family efflux transporter MFP subunit